MKLEALEVITNRRSIRKFKPTQITLEELDTVLEAGTYAPTGGGRQMPLIVSVQDTATINVLSKLNAEIMGKDMDPYYGAPTIVLVFAPEGDPTGVEDGSCILQTMMLAAYAAGLGSCWINREKQMFHTPQGKELMRQWGVPDNMEGIGAISLGYPDGPHPKAANRKDGYIIKIGK